MTETFIAHVNGSHACYQTQTGVDRAFIGCTHATPRQAIDHTTRKEDTDAFHPDRARTSLVNPADTVPVSRSVLDRLTPPQGCAEEDSGPAQNEAPGQPTRADGPRRPAPTGSIPPAPVGAPRHCIFEPCVATWRHWHGGFPGGYDNPDDPTGMPILFEGDDPDPGAVRDYNGAALPPPTDT